MPPRRRHATRREHAAPVRTCVGCGRRAAREDLVRFVAVDGVLTPGPALPGRGAYTCRDASCFEQALRRRAFARHLRANVVAEPELLRLYTGESDG